MAQFDPLEFGYYLFGNVEGFSHYQKEILQEKINMVDIIELVHCIKVDTWAMVIKPHNLKQFLPTLSIFSDDITLFIGKIKNDFDFRFIMSKIVKDPKILIQMGA